MKEELGAFWHYTIGKFFYQKPPILTLFVTNKCNARCQHCFYWKNLQSKKKQEISLETISKLSKDLGHLELLLISGGEPFLRNDLAKICQLFFDNNQLKSVSIPTNGLMPGKIVKETEKILKISPRLLVIIPLSLDGTKEIHDKIRGVKGAFKKLQETSKRLFKLSKQYPNLRIRFTATVFDYNYKNLFELIDQMPKLFPESKAFWALSLNFLRGQPRNPDLKLPLTPELKKLFSYKTKKFKEKRSWITVLFEKINFAAAIKTIEKGEQIVPCEAGRLLAVVYEDGLVSHCELLPPIGSLKEKSFKEIWQSQKAKNLRTKIIRKDCYCTHGCNLFPSLIAHPLGWLRLVKS